MMCKIIKILVAILIIILFTCCKSTKSVVNSSSIDNSSEFTYLVWQDEFSGSGLPDNTKWNYERGYVRNNEMQYYTAGRIDNIYQKNGFLYIKAMNDSAVIDGRIRPITSASITSKGKGDWKYGRIEVRAKLPAIIKGTWPAIWMMPTVQNYGSWPKCGEIDILEYVGYEPDSVYFNIHTKKYNHLDLTALGNSIKLNDIDEFHVYTIEWTENSIKWFVDGKKVYAFDNEKEGWESWPFDQKFYLILNFAFGGSWGGVNGVNPELLPAEFVIDYVRVYQ